MPSRHNSPVAAKRVAVFAESGTCVNVVRRGQPLLDGCWPGAPGSHESNAEVQRRGEEKRRRQYARKVRATLEGDNGMTNTVGTFHDHPRPNPPTSRYVRRPYACHVTPDSQCDQSDVQERKSCR